MKKTLLLFSFLSFQLGAMAQESAPTEPEFETDRPDLTEASSVMARKYVQLETGVQYLKYEQDRVQQTQWLYPQALLRIGVLKAAELRLEATFRQEEMKPEGSPTQKIDGFSTLRVGTKVKFLQEQGLRPEASVLAMLELPWSDDAFAPKNVLPEVRFLFTNTLSPAVKLQYNVGFRREAEEGETEDKFQYSVALGQSLGEKVSVFVEFAGDKPKGSPAQNMVDVGAQFMVLPNLQLDAIVGTGVTSHAPELFLGGGISLRLPR